MTGATSSLRWMMAHDPDKLDTEDSDSDSDNETGRRSRRNWYFEGRQVCRASFIALLGVGPGRLSRCGARYLGFDLRHLGFDLRHLGLGLISAVRMM